MRYIGRTKRFFIGDRFDEALRFLNGVK